MLISGKLELDYCLYASNSTPAKPIFAKYVKQLQEWFPGYLIKHGEIQQIFVPVTKEQFEANHNLGRVVSLIEGIGYSVVKKMTIEIALPDITEVQEDLLSKLSDVLTKVTSIHNGPLITSRIVITKFLSNEIAH